MRGRSGALLTIGLAVTASVSAWDGSQDLEPDLSPDAVLLFEDFERPSYADDWPTYWGSPAGAGTVESPPTDVFEGVRSAYLQGRAGEHDSEGSGEYVPDIPPDGAAFVRLYYRLQDGFHMGTCNQLKLFAVQGGATNEDCYGGAGTPPDGTDKFSSVLAINTERELHFYYYHPEQSGGYGDHSYCDLSGERAALTPGAWICLEMMLQPNTPGEHDGVLRAWVDDELVGEVTGIRFRDLESLKARRFTFISYFGGSGDENTSPVDQRTFLDNVVVGRTRVGCLGAALVDGGAGGDSGGSEADAGGSAMDAGGIQDAMGPGADRGAISDTGVSALDGSMVDGGAAAAEDPVDAGCDCRASAHPPCAVCWVVLVLLLRVGRSTKGGA